MPARADVIGANLVLACQRSDCTEQAIIELAEIGRFDRPGPFAGLVAASLVSELVELDGGPNDTWREIEGWGYDTLEDGVNRALHCPRHRTTGKGWPS